MSTRSSRPSRRGRLLAFARAAVCLLVILVVLLASCLRSAHARLGEALLGFGDQLVKMQDLKANSAPRRLSINGLSMGVLTLSTKVGVKDALNRFQAQCQQHGGLQVPRALASKLGSARNAFDGTIRREAQNEGMLACIDSGHTLSLGELTERLSGVRDSGDLAALGELRYVFARRSGGTTTLLVFWTDGSAPLLKLFPSRGDALGRDTHGVPRPDGSRRLLAAAEVGTPYSLVVYRVPETRLEVLAPWYRRELKASGWQVLQDGPGAPLRALRDGRIILVNCSRATTGAALVTVAELQAEQGL